MNKLSEWMIRVSSGKLSMFMLAVFIAFTVVVLPRQAARAAERAAGIGSPDSSFVYSTEDLYRMASAYGEAGRRDYVLERFTFDLVWPVVYTAFLVVAMSWLIKKTAMGWRRLNLLPLLAASLDYLENCLAAIVMTRFPDPTPLLDWLLPPVTLLKWVTVGLSFIVLVALTGIWLSRFLWSGKAKMN
jgi:hypothetical protein